ncbi:MAG: leucine-rich repeat domain-containing protein [Ruminococcus sp.]|nr:leucine-rich repeat domain-containing protein [Ruminococcus sp.]
MRYEDLFEFEDTGGAWELTKFLRRLPTFRVKIPGRYMDMPVERIGRRAFYNSQRLEDVYIPPEVKVIGEGAFACCANLSAVEFSEGLTEIGGSAFENCDNNLITLSLPKSLERVGSHAFAHCWNLDTVKLPNKETRLGADVFYGCPKLCAETQLVSILGSCDLSSPLPPDVFNKMRYTFGGRYDPLLREDVFTLAVDNGCFGSASADELSVIFGLLLERGLDSLFFAAANGGLISSAELCDTVVEQAARFNRTEAAAWLLEYKNRRFGFASEDKYEL